MSEKIVYNVFNTNISKLEDSFKMLFSMMGFTNSVSSFQPWVFRTIQRILKYVLFLRSLGVGPDHSLSLRLAATSCQRCCCSVLVHIVRVRSIVVL